MADRKEPHRYELCGSDGSRLGVVNQVDIKRRSSALRKVTNFFEWTSSLPDTQLDVVDLHGALCFTVIFSGEDAQFTAAVLDADGSSLGEIIKASGWRKIHFDLRANGMALGTVEAESLSGWDYLVHQEQAAVGTITRSGTTFLKRARSDDFRLDLDRPLKEPLRTLVVACAIGMDVSVSNDDVSGGLS